MGNKLGRRRSSVDERYTRPQGLYQHRDIDRRKLRRLILDSKLAPCYAGADDPAVELDECPICFLHYPSLNRSKCCTKGICTECFLQMKSPQSVQPTQCPYCKTLNYAVEYRGLKSEEEKGLEQVEEQKVIEAKIRMQQNELEEEQQQRTPGRLQTDYLSDNTAAVEGGRSTTAVSYTTRSTTATETGFDQGSTGSSSTYFRRNRDEFDLDLEDIMVMEAIWLSIQEQNAETYIEQKFQAPSSGDISSCVTPMQGNNVNHSMELPASLVNSGDVSGMSSLTGGLAGAIAEMAERNITGGSIHETLSLDPVDGFSSLPTASDLQPDRPFTSDFFQIDDLNNLSEDRVNMAMCSNSVGDKDAQGINDKLLKAQVEGNSTTEKTHHYIYTLCCEDHDTKNFVGDSSKCQQACLTSMGNRLKSSTEAIIASYDSAGPSKTRICTDTTSELSSQDLITPCEEPYVNAGEGAVGVSVVPKNFEDQITLAMPLAEARTDCQSQHEEESHQVSSNVI